MSGDIALAAIDRLRPALKELALRIWNEPEPPFHEAKAAAWTAQLLRDGGFDVTVGVAGLPTAMTARFGRGRPVIGFLGEYDPLPGMSQKADCPRQEPVTPGGYGHACGHNLLGTANVGAVLGAAEEMRAAGLEGTLVFFGCPAEELTAGKGIMARAGLFDELDACLVFHPDVRNVVQRGANVACATMDFRFRGRSAHAGGDPENGRSALKALELCGVGTQYLREHFTSDVRVHYCITDGGRAMNIIPDTAAASYGVRAKDIETLRDVRRRVENVARGAALMTETTVEIEEGSACCDTLNNGVYGELMQQCLQDAPFEPWSDEDLALARAFNETCRPVYERMAEKLGVTDGAPLYTGVSAPNFAREMASTDAGDVMHIAPGINFGAACAPLCAMPHTWQAASAYGGEIGVKGMIYAAKAMALFALRLAERPELTRQARAEFLAATGGRPYQCPLSEEKIAALLAGLRAEQA